jgi:hypothetical protein
MRAVGREPSGSDIFVVIGRNALASGCWPGRCLVMVGWWGRDRTACAVPLLLRVQRCGAVFVLAAGRVCLGGNGVDCVEYGRWPNGSFFARFPGALPLAMLREAFGQREDLKPALQAWGGVK